jgi:hypothetical protein
MGGVVKAVTKPIKKVVKSVSKVVKKVAKTVVNVGKKVVKGVKSAVKGIGKAVSKLGPVGQIALMAVGGYFLAPMMAGTWGAMGISSKIGLSMANGALTGFIASGGDVKAALLSGATAGLGSAAGALAKGGTAGLEAAWASNPAGNVFNGVNVTDFSSGWDATKARWSDFTNTISSTGKTITENIGDWFTDKGNTSLEAGGAQKTNAAINGVAANNGEILTQSQMDIQAAKTPYPDIATYAEENMLDYQPQQVPVIPSPADTSAFANEAMLDTAYTTDTAARSYTPYMEQFGGTSLNQQANTSLGQNFNRLVRLGQQNPNISQLSYDNLSSTMESFGTDKVAASNYFENMATKFNQNNFDITPYTTNDWLSDMSTMSTYNVGAASTLGTTPEAAQARAGIGQPSSSLLDKAGDAMDALSKGYQAWAGMQKTSTGGGTTPSWVTSVPAGDTLLGKAGGIGGTAGGGVFTPEQEQYQKQLLAAIRQQEEMAKQRAAAGWGVA